MGNLLRCFWQPFALVSELPGADCDPLRVRLLGDLVIEIDGIAVEPPASRRARALLGWLALDRRSHSRSALAARFWPDVLDESARTSLRLHWEFPDIELAARALASTGPAYLAIQHVGEEAFMASARQAAAGLYVEGVGVRAEVEVQCLVGVVPD